MATKFLTLLFMLSLCFFLAMPSPSSGRTTMYQDVKNRKMLHDVKMKEMVLKSGLMHEAASRGNNTKKFVSGELREAPLGPDPLHHHGIGPKKPRTP